MSAYTTVSTRIVSAEHLARALRDAGFAEVEVHDVAQPLYGFEGLAREERAEVIVRRDLVGEASNDIGFARGADGTFDAIVSEWDREILGAAWLTGLTQRYAYHVARDRLEARGFDLVDERVEEGESIRLTLRRAT